MMLRRRRRRPNFDSEPIPIIPKELESLAAYLDRQFKKIEERWPKSIEEKVDALLEKLPFSFGQADFYQQVLFDVGIETPRSTLVCGGQSESYLNEADAGMGSIESFDYSPSSGLMYATGSPSDSIRASTISIDPADGTITRLLSGRTRHGHILGSDFGSFNNKDKLYVMTWTGSGNKILKKYGLNPFTEEASNSIGTLNYHFIAEGNSYLYLFPVGGGQPVMTISKSSYGTSFPVGPSGWKSFSSGGGRTGGVSLDAHSLQVCLQSTTVSTSFGFVVISGTSYLSVKSNSESLLSVKANPVYHNGKIYWAAMRSVSGVEQARILITDASGNLLDSISATPGSTDNFGSSDKVLTLNEEDNSIFYFVGNTLYNFHTQTQLVSSCSLSIPTGWSSLNIEAIKYLNDHCWVVDPNVSGLSGKVGAIQKKVY